MNRTVPDNISVLLVEDNDDDAELTLRVFRQYHFANHIHVVRDGAEALDCLFGKGAYGGHNACEQTKLILLIIIADTKFEFGVDDKGEILLIDEVLTPDSSRFWARDTYEPGHPQPSFDKQFVREYLESLDWGKTPPAPALPDDIATATTERYLRAYKLLTGKELPVV